MVWFLSYIQERVTVLKWPHGTFAQRSRKCLFSLDRGLRCFLHVEPPWTDWYWSQALWNGALPFYEKISLSDLPLPLLGKLILWSALAYVLTSRSPRWICLHSLLVFFWHDVAFITFSEKDQFFIFLFSTECVRS